MHPEQSAIVAVFKEVASVFSGLDLARFRQCYRLPCQMITAHGVATASTETEFEAFFRPLMEQLRRNGFGRSELDEIYVRVQAEDIALASTAWTRYRTDGSELERLGATYTLKKAEGAWRIVTLIAHSTAAVLRLDRL